MPFSMLRAHSEVLSCSVNTIFKPIACVCYSIYYPSKSSHLIIVFFTFYIFWNCIKYFFKVLSYNLATLIFIHRCKHSTFSRFHLLHIESQKFIGNENLISKNFLDIFSTGNFVTLNFYSFRYCALLRSKLHLRYNYFLTFK